MKTRRHYPPGPLARGAFTLLEMLLVMGIAFILLSLLMPVLSVVRRKADATKCLANLRQVSAAFQMYANDNRGYIPRGTTYALRKWGCWARGLSKYLGKEVTEELNLKELPSIQCPSMPLDDVPTGFVINQFSFENGVPIRRWGGPRLLASVKNPSHVALLMDSATYYQDTARPEMKDGVFFIGLHNLWQLEQLPMGKTPRAARDRHGRDSINVLFMDGGASHVKVSAVNARMVDDGINKEMNQVRQWPPKP